MCDPVSLLVGAVAGGVASKVLGPKGSNASPNSAANAPDPAAERAKAEAEAAQRANAQLAASNARRREQQSLMSKGAPAAPSFGFGDSETAQPGGSPLSGGVRSMPVRVASTLMSRGAMTTAGAAPVYSGGGGGRSSEYRMSQQ